MAALLVFSWALPLTVWSTVSISGAIAVLMMLALYPARSLGFRAVIRQEVTIATIGFFGIGVFGVLYAICALGSNGHSAAMSRDSVTRS